MNVACALKSNGLVRYVTNLSQCKNNEDQVSIKPGPVSFCIQPDGTVRKIPPFQCKKPGVVLTLPPASGTVYFCAANSTGVLRKVNAPSDCTATEFPVFVGPNDPAPSVSSTAPANGATNVGVSSNISVTFSESVTASGSSFTLNCAGSKTFSVSGSPGTTITLDPTADLPAGTTCTVTVIANQISDTDSLDPPDNMAANYLFSFTTDSAPSVTTTSPANGATDVSASANISVTFTEPVNASATSFTVECPTGSAQAIGVTGSGTSTVTIDPTSDLPGATICTVTVLAGGITDVDSGDPPDTMAVNYVFSFTTADAAPAVAATSPANGATEVARNTDIDITFSEPVTASGSSFTVECPAPGNAQAFSVSGSPGSAITLDPTSDLPAGAVCTVTVIANQVSDVDSADPPDNMAANYVFSFSVAANQAPTDIQLSNSSVDENQPIGTSVGTFSTTDPDAGDTFTYALVTGTGSDDNGSFTIAGDTLKTDEVFDFDLKSTYAIRVATTDSGGHSFEKQFTITINDANEAPTDISLSNDSIDENQPSGTTIGTLAATDADAGQTHTFSLQSSGCSGSFPDNSSFQISGGSLQSAVSFNFEVKSSYTICIRTTDSGTPNLSFDEQFTITINDVNDAPVGVADSYSGAIGNTLAVLGTGGSGPRVVLTGNVLTNNDTDEDVPAQPLSAVAETNASTGGGTATISSDGNFTFLPGVGDKNQTDTFTYHVTDGIATSAGTVSVQIDNFLVWYVDNALGSNGTGRSSSPFNTLAGVNGAGGSGDSDGTGDIIFLYQGSGSYGGGIPLEANQRLLGEKAGLLVNGNQLVAAGSTAPVITNASGAGVGLASGVDVQGLNISGTSGDGINGSAVTTAAVGTTSAVNISSAGGDGVDLSGAASGNISIAAPISGSAARSVSVANRSGGTVAFSGSIADTGTGISLSSNTGATINLTGGITASTGANNAFSATGGGTVNVTGSANTLATTSGTALKVDSTAIGSSGLTFRSIAAGTASGSAGNGIFLSNTGASGGLTVAGTGTAGSGGTIQNKTGADGTTDGIGIYLNNTSSVSLARMQLNDFSNFAVRGTGVAGFSLTDSTINGGNGTNPAGDEASVAFNNLTGSASITNANISGGVEDAVRIHNTTGSLNSLSITGSTFATTGAGTSNDALSLIGGAGATVFNATVTGNSFTRAQVDLFRYLLETGTGTLNFSSNTVTNTFPTTLVPGGGDINIASGSAGNSPSLTYTVNDNSIYTSGVGLQVPNGSVIVVAATPQGSATGTISNNTIGATGVSQSGGFDSILVRAGKAGFHKVTITGNTIRRYKQTGIRILGGSPAASPGFNIRATVKSNTILEPDSVAFAGIDAEVGADPADIGTMCLDLGGSGAEQNSVVAGDPNNFNDINLIQQFATTINLPGYAGANTNDAAVQAFVVGRNSGNGAPTVFASHDTTTADGNPAGGGFTGTGINCA